jgi:7,8-dihydropterin-6-yl-methyl-4-(beta-D-ribofuranosyl)aminobenzene 5'-phosphate synthase
MRLSVIFDNYPYDSRLQTSWGFAAWLEYGGRTILFDTGSHRSVLLHNMAALALDPLMVDSIVLSHNHGDHTGGLAAVLAPNPHITVYAPQALSARLKGEVRATGASLVEVSHPVQILPGLQTTGQMGTGPFEQALVARTEKGLVVVCGCAHPGVHRMVARAKTVGRGDIALVAGGFDLFGAGPWRIRRTLFAFRRLGVRQVAPCHCTGDHAREIFFRAYGEDFYASGAGWQWPDLAGSTSFNA